MSFKAKVFGLVFTLAFWGAGAQAADVFCNNYYNDFIAIHPVPIFQCVSTTVGPGSVLSISSDNGGGGTLSAAKTSAGSGVEASASTAGMGASPGALSGDVSAAMPGSMTSQPS
jgi:hypothetical protein